MDKLQPSTADHERSIDNVKALMHMIHADTDIFQMLYYY